MNCVAPSVASLIVGLVIGAVATAFLASVIAAVLHEYIVTDELKRMRKVAKAAWSLLDDERVEAFVAEDANENAPAETYEVPADVWEAFEKAVDKAGDKS